MSSAQSKRVGRVGTARLGWGWGELGCTGVDYGLDGERGVLRGIDGIVGDAARV